MLPPILRLRTKRQEEAEQAGEADKQEDEEETTGPSQQDNVKQEDLVGGIWSYTGHHYGYP